MAADIEGQADQTWKNIEAILAAAGMGVENLVKCTHYLTRADDVAAYGKVRTPSRRRATCFDLRGRHRVSEAREYWSRSKPWRQRPRRARYDPLSASCRTSSSTARSSDPNWRAV